MVMCAPAQSSRDGVHAAGDWSLSIAVCTSHREFHRIVIYVHESTLLVRIEASAFA
jgi:hypothetical protein